MVLMGTLFQFHMFESGVKPQRSSLSNAWFTELAYFYSSLKVRPKTIGQFFGSSTKFTSMLNSLSLQRGKKICAAKGIATAHTGHERLSDKCMEGLQQSRNTRRITQEGSKINCARSQDQYRIPRSTVQVGWLDPISCGPQRLRCNKFCSLGGHLHARSLRNTSGCGSASGTNVQA